MKKVTMVTTGNAVWGTDAQGYPLLGARMDGSTDGGGAAWLAAWDALAEQEPPEYTGRRRDDETK